MIIIPICTSGNRSVEGLIKLHEVTWQGDSEWNLQRDSLDPWRPGSSKTAQESIEGNRQGQDVHREEHLGSRFWCGSVAVIGQLGQQRSIHTRVRAIRRWCC